MNWRLILLACMVSISSWVHGQVFDMIVSTDTAGDYRSIQEAIDAVPDNSSGRILLFVKNGIYNEKVVLPPAKVKVSMIGQSADAVIISWDDNAQEGMSSAETYTFWADADDFYAENITFRNTSGKDKGQALAIRTTGDRMVFKNCRFLGFQDTYYAHKRRQYNLRCYVEGGTDFIYGDATAVFQKSEIHCVKNGQYITAPADTKLVSNTPDGKFYHGLLFRECDVVAGEGVLPGIYYLGRPWQPDASSVYINCRLDKHIKSIGWSTWSDNNHLSGCFAEYNNTDFDGNLIDVSNRATWSKQLTWQEVNSYYNLDYFLGKSGIIWDPLPVTWSLEEPVNITVAGTEIDWEDISGAPGYVVYLNDSVAGITESSSIILADTLQETDTLFVKSVNVNGNLSGFPNEEYDPVNLKPVKQENFKVIQYGNYLLFSESASYRIYNLKGILVRSGGPALETGLRGLTSGLYILTVKSKNGKGMAQKLVISSQNY